MIIFWIIYFTICVFYPYNILHYFLFLKLYNKFQFVELDLLSDDFDYKLNSNYYSLSVKEILRQNHSLFRWRYKKLIPKWDNSIDWRKKYKELINGQ